MIRDQNGASSAISGETESGHRTVECEESETAAARNSKTPADEEHAGDWSEKDSDGTSSTEIEVKAKEKTKTPGNVSPGESQSDNKSLRRPCPRKPVLPGESLGRSCDRSKVQSASGTVPHLCRSRKAGALRGRRGRRGNGAVPEPELQSSSSCERSGSPHGRTPLLSIPVRETGWTKARPILESSQRVEKESSDKITTTTSKDDLVRRLLGNGKKQESADGHPRDDDDRNLLPPWRTTAVKAGGLDQTHSWSGMRLVSAPPSCATRRAKQNSKLRRHQGSQKRKRYWQPVAPQRNFSNTVTKNSRKSFDEQHVFWG